MHQLEILFLLMGVIIGTSIIANKVKLPFPILLTIAGLIIGLWASTPLISVDPEVVFLIFLPPLLFEAAHSVSWHEFREFQRPILILAIGLVLFTATCVAITSHWLIPGFTLIEGLLLGAIIAPPDAVAATSAIKDFDIPKPLVTILEGESLVNDASSLILYQFSLMALMNNGNVSLFDLPKNFLLVSGGGVILGLIAAFLVAQLTRRLNDATIATVLSLLIPMIIYVAAEEFHVSGVLAVVSCGLYLSWYSSEIITFQARFKLKEFWEVLTFILNGIIFILLGLQLPRLTAQFSPHQMKLIIGYGLLISLVVIIARILWVFPMAKLNIYFYNRRNSSNIQVTRDHYKQIFILSWAGMRGMVSLAIAMAIPLTMTDGNSFANRDQIILIAFIVIIVTLLVHGLSLPFLIKWLQLKTDKNNEISQESQLQQYLLTASLEFVETQLAHAYPDHIIDQLRLRIIKDLDAQTTNAKTNTHEQFEAISRLIHYQRTLLHDTHRNNKYPTELIRKIEVEIDVLDLFIHHKHKK